MFAVVPFEDIFNLLIYMALTLSPSVQVLSQVFSEFVICQFSYKCTVFSTIERSAIPLVPCLQRASCSIPDGNSNQFFSVLKF